MRRGPYLVLAAAALWGTTGTIQELGPPGSDPLAVGIARLIVGSLGLLAATGATGRLGSIRGLPILPTSIAAAGIAAYQVAFFAGVRRAGVALATMIAIGSAPLFTGLLSALAERRTPDRRWSVATLIALAGLGLVAGPRAGSSTTGVILALAAGLSYAVFALGSKRLVDRLAPAGAMSIVFTCGALMLAPLIPISDTSFLTKPGGLATALWLGLVATSASYLLYGNGLRSTPLATAATLSLAEPLVATLLAVTVLGERPGALRWLGMAMIGTALALLVTWVPRPNRA